MRKMKTAILMVFMLVLGLAACSTEEGSREGFILEVSDDSILVVQNINLERYKEIKDVSSEALIDQGGLDLIWLDHAEANELQKGDNIEFWIDGNVRESYPAQAKAEKIEHK